MYSSVRDQPGMCSAPLDVDPYDQAAWYACDHCPSLILTAEGTTNQLVPPSYLNLPRCTKVPSNVALRCLATQLALHKAARA